jgi:single-strand DNA-binding protein
MNSCILIAEVTRPPQLRYTQDNQTAIADMEVQFSGLRPDDPPAKLKVIGWGNLAQEMQQQYQVGDQLVIEGRLNINTIDRPEGFKEKIPELTANRIYGMGAVNFSAPTPIASDASPTYPVASPVASSPATAPAPDLAASPKSTASKARTPKPPIAEPETDFDDIPF